MESEGLKDAVKKISKFKNKSFALLFRQIKFVNSQLWFFNQCLVRLFNTEEWHFEFWCIFFYFRCSIILYLKNLQKQENKGICGSFFLLHHLFFPPNLAFFFKNEKLQPLGNQINWLMLFKQKLQNSFSLFFVTKTLLVLVLLF